MAVIAYVRRRDESDLVDWRLVAAGIRVGLACVLILALMVGLMAIAGLALPPHPADAVPEPGLVAWRAEAGHHSI